MAHNWHPDGLSILALEKFRQIWAVTLVTHVGSQTTRTGRLVEQLFAAPYYLS